MIISFSEKTHKKMSFDKNSKHFKKQPFTKFAKNIINSNPYLYEFGNENDFNNFSNPYTK